MKQVFNFSGDIYWKECAHLHTALKVWFWKLLACVKLSLMLFLTRLWRSWYVCNVLLSVPWPPWGFAFVTFNSIIFNLLLNGYELLTKERSLFLSYHASFKVLIIPLRTNSWINSCIGLDRLWGVQEAEISIFQENWHLKVVRSQPYAPAVLTLGKYTWYSLLLAAESTPEP